MPLPGALGESSPQPLALHHGALAKTGGASSSPLPQVCTSLHTASHWFLSRNRSSETAKALSVLACLPLGSSIHMDGVLRATALQSLPFSWETRT